MIEQDPRYQKIARMLERDAEIKRLRIKEKLTLQEIGNRFGISRERVRQIIEGKEHK